MNQPREDALGCQAFQMLARLTQAPSVQSHCAYLKLAPNQVIQRHAARHEVSPRCSGRDHNFLFAFERLDGLDFDQRDFATYGGRFRRVSRSIPISLAFQSAVDDRFSALPRLHGRAGLRRNVNRTQITLEHSLVSAQYPSPLGLLKLPRTGGWLINRSVRRELR